MKHHPKEGYNLLHILIQKIIETLYIPRLYCFCNHKNACLKKNDYCGAPMPMPLLLLFL